ncbi:hypothetical protein [Ferdinandcohnia sp. Marseille-Q9671]
MRKLLGSTLAFGYLIFPMSFILLILLVTPLMFLSDVSAIRTSGFAGPDTALSMIGVSGLVIGISLLVPVLRRIYAVFPWLYPFVKIFFVGMVIINIALSILNFGYQTVSGTRHMLFFILMIVFVVLGRLGMSFYFHRNPVHEEGE